ncbi:hypothetical protein CLIB1423_10S00254 [[Candida] railenensis]|uniref:Uncharacterized protein n=1 Tax=[Candida] railenensis TaxID=45579 RepID=A0A9P0QRB6_9ASCO|nr:hypothetical protein CLIB1423_10S00254 [[Candida] railenensis]
MPNPTVTPDRLDKYKKQLYQSGAIGGLEGTLVGLLSGFYILHTYNHGRNVKAFSLPIRVLYLSSWCVAGIVFSTNVEKSRIVKQMLVEHNIKREQFLNEEFNRKVEGKR